MSPSLPRRGPLSVLRSQSQNIFLNIAYEEHLTRCFFPMALYKAATAASATTASDHPKMVDGTTNDPFRACLLLYRNTTSVVMGRNQVAWLETTLARRKGNHDNNNNGVQIARRPSGGGCVYVDPGCLCFSILTPRVDYDPKRSIRVVTGAVSELLGSTNDSRTVSFVSESTRQDVYVGGKKVTGSAMRLIRTGAYHHGTLLVNSDLEKLRGVLGPVWGKGMGDGLICDVENKGSESVPHPVTSLREAMAGATAVDMEAVESALVAAFVKEYGVVGDSVEVSDVPEEGMASASASHLSGDVRTYSRDATRDDAAALRSTYEPDSWVYGAGPAFHFCLDVAVLREKHGIDLLPDGAQRIRFSVRGQKITGCEVKFCHDDVMTRPPPLPHCEAFAHALECVLGGGSRLFGALDADDVVNDVTRLVGISLYSGDDCNNDAVMRSVGEQTRRLVGVLHNLCGC